MKRMLTEWEREHPGRVDSIFAAIGNVAPSQLADTDLFDFASLQQKVNDIELDRIQAINE